MGTCEPGAASCFLFEYLRFLWRAVGAWRYGWSFFPEFKLSSIVAAAVKANEITRGTRYTRYDVVSLSWKFLLWSPGFDKLYFLSIFF